MILPRLSVPEWYYEHLIKNIEKVVILRHKVNNFLLITIRYYKTYL